MKYLTVLILFFSVAAFPQKKDPDAILKKAELNFNRIQDYQADVKIKVNVDFLKVPDMKAKIYFKQPDKMQLDSEGFAMLPKGGMNFSPSSLLSGKYTSFYIKDENFAGANTTVIKIVPLEDRGDIVLSTLWIDTDYYRIVKVESTTKTQGTFQIELKYSEGMEYPLPSSMIFTFNVDKMNLPQGLQGESATKEKKMEDEDTATGKVFVNYSDYKINRGIPDNIFSEPEKK